MDDLFGRFTYIWQIIRAQHVCPTPSVVVNYTDCEFHEPHASDSGRSLDTDQWRKQSDHILQEMFTLSKCRILIDDCDHICHNSLGQRWPTATDNDDGWWWCYTSCLNIETLNHHLRWDLRHRDWTIGSIRGYVVQIPLPACSCLAVVSGRPNSVELMVMRWAYWVIYCHIHCRVLSSTTRRLNCNSKFVISNQRIGQLRDCWRCSGTTQVKWFCKNGSKLSDLRILDKTTRAFVYLSFPPNSIFIMRKVVPQPI